MTNIIKKKYTYVIFIVICVLLSWSISLNKTIIEKVITTATLSLSGCLSIAMFHKKGFDISIINTIMATLMAIVFWRNNNIALFLLMMYSIVSSIYMSFIAIEGQRTIQNPKLYFLILGLIFILSLVIYWFSGKFKTIVSYVLIFEFLSFFLTAISQTLLVTQSRWLFLTFALKDVAEIILGLTTFNILIVVKNIFFFFTNLISFVIWAIDLKHDHKVDIKTK